ncbi:MAG: shikimate kinase [Blastocatellia bacterium]|nr:shikimate kinase [Blastocatellia bacterium]
MSVEPQNLTSTTQNLFLVGFMASGKTTVGRTLAAQLDVPFIDLDEEIERAAGCTIAEMIQRQGEAAFRQLETACLREASTQKTAVISLGGGAFTQTINREVVAQTGISVWLDAPFALCWERIQRDAVVRPLAPTSEEAQARYRQRVPIYEQAQIRIPVESDSTPMTLAATIMKQLRDR